MSAIVLRIAASTAAEEISHREHTHAKDVKTLRNLLNAKEVELLSSHSSVALLQAELREAHSSVAKLKNALDAVVTVDGASVFGTVNVVRTAYFTNRIGTRNFSVFGGFACCRGNPISSTSVEAPHTHTPTHTISSRSQ
jgi:hypothetical protein